MAVFRGIQGTPWHVERYHVESDDHRRHRGKCSYYEKQSKHCCKRMTECYGASHCKFYRESKARITKEEWEKIVSKSRHKELEVESSDTSVNSASNHITEYPKGVTAKELNRLSFDAYICFIECMKKSSDHIIFFERINQFLEVLGLTYEDKKQMFETIMLECVYLDGRELKMRPHRAFKNTFLKLSEGSRSMAEAKQQR